MAKFENRIRNAKTSRIPKRGLDNNRKWKSVEEDAKKRPCRRESRPREFRNRSMSRTFENGPSLTFSARFDDRKRFATSNESFRNAERSERTPESAGKRRFSKGAPTRKKPKVLSSFFRSARKFAENRLPTRSDGGVRGGSRHVTFDQDGAYAFSGRD